MSLLLAEKIALILSRAIFIFTPLSFTNASLSADAARFLAFPARLVAGR